MTMPVPGTAPWITNNSRSWQGTQTFTLNWGAATDSGHAQNTLQYKIVRASTYEKLDTVAECQAIQWSMYADVDNVIRDWTTNLTTCTFEEYDNNDPYNNWGGTSIYGYTRWLAVLVKDPGGFIALYPVVALDNGFSAISNPAITSSSSVTTSSMSLNWSAVTEQGQSSFQYKVVKVVSYALAPGNQDDCTFPSTQNSQRIVPFNALNSITGADLVMDWTSNVTTCSVTGLTEGWKYWFALLVKDPVGNVEFSPYVSYYTADTHAPTLPNSVLTYSSVTSSSLNVNMTKAIDNSDRAIYSYGDRQWLSYAVYKSLSNNMTTIADTKANGTSDSGFRENANFCWFGGLAADTLYYFSAIVKDQAGNETFYTPGSQRTLAADITPPTPGNGGVFTVTNIGQYGATLHIPNPADDRDPVYGLTCNVYRSASNNITSVSDILANGTYVTDGSWSDWEPPYEATVNVSGLSLGTTYYFNVLTQDSAGNMSAYQPLSLTTLPESVIPTLPLAAPTSLVALGQGGTDSFFLLNQGSPWGETEFIGRLVTLTEAISGRLTLKFKVRNATGQQYNNDAMIQGWIQGVNVGGQWGSSNSYSWQMGSGSPELLPSADFSEVAFVFNTISLPAGTYRFLLYSTFSSYDGGSAPGLQVRLNSVVAESGTATHTLPYQSPDDAYTGNVTMEALLAYAGVVSVLGSTTSSVSLGWEKATDNVTAQASLRYAVYRYTDGTLANVSQIESTATLAASYATDISQATISGLTIGTVYWWYVVVKDLVGNKTPYKAVQGDTEAISDVTNPTIGTSIVVSNVTALAATLTWGAASDDTSVPSALSYRVVKGAEAAAIDTVPEASAAETVMDWSTNVLTTTLGSGDIIQGATVHFTVLVRDEVGNTSVYSPVPVTALDGTAPTPGNDITYTNITPTSATVNWGMASDNVTTATALQYKLVRAATAAALDTVAEADSATVAMNWTANVLTYPVSISGVEYFAVLVKDAAGNKALYPPQPTVVDTMAPIPSGSASVAGMSATSVGLAWERATDDVTPQAQLKYGVYRTSVGTYSTAEEVMAAGSIVVPFSPNRTQGNISGLTADTSCWFYVLVKDLADNLAMYPAINVVTQSAGSTAAITGEVVIEKTEGAIQVSNTAVAAGAKLTLNATTMDELVKAAGVEGKASIVMEAGSTINLGGETYIVPVKMLYKIRLL